MKLIKEEYKNNVWIFNLMFDKREMQFKYYPKKDEGSGDWINGLGSMKEMDKAKQFLATKKIMPRLKSLIN